MSHVDLLEKYKRRREDSFLDITVSAETLSPLKRSGRVPKCLRWCGECFHQMRRHLYVQQLHTF
jgi:fatty acid-binding protein DegV